MQINRRGELRKRSTNTYSLVWQEQGSSHSLQVKGTDESASGIGVHCSTAVQAGTRVYLQSGDGDPAGYCIVRHVTKHSDTLYHLGLEWEESRPDQTQQQEPAVTYYELLQINPNAQAETIQRIYHFLASRYHPDNPETGDPERFILLTEAYEVLYNSERRAQYDAALQEKAGQPHAAFDSVDFLDGVEGERNRRMAVLALLYRQCRVDINHPQISLLELETQMGFPREYLDFTLWYLRHKMYIEAENGAEFSLTCLGVDYVEEQGEQLPLVGKLLQAGAPGTYMGPEKKNSTTSRTPTFPLLSSGERDPDARHIQP